MRFRRSRSRAHRCACAVLSLVLATGILSCDAGTELTPRFPTAEPESPSPSGGGPEPALDEIVLLDLVTPDGSGQTVHPDYASASSWLSPADWLAITPYPDGNANFENPSLFTADEEGWRPPADGHNPVVKPT